MAWGGAGEGKDRPLQHQTFHRTGALSVRRTGDKHQAYLCHKADHLRFAQKTDGTALVEGNQEALRLKGSHGPKCLRSPHLFPPPLLQQTWDPRCGALRNQDWL